MRDFIRDSTPARRRQRYGDVEYDWEHRVDTTSATVSFRNRLLGVFHSAYQPTDEVAFREMIGELPIRHDQFTFIDLGSGKGRTLLMAAEYGFRRIVGVELLPELHKTAQENIEKLITSRKMPADIQSICQDARDFEFPVEPLIVFLFHPFPEPVLEEVVNRLSVSLRKDPRSTYVVYHNPVLGHVLEESPALKVLRRAEQYTVFLHQL